MATNENSIMKIKKSTAQVDFFIIVLFTLSGGIVVKIALNENDGCTLVSRAAGEVAERADEVGELTRRRSLCRHVAHEASALRADALRDRRLERLAR